MTQRLLLWLDFGAKNIINSPFFNILYYFLKNVQNVLDKPFLKAIIIY